MIKKTRVNCAEIVKLEMHLSKPGLKVKFKKNNVIAFFITGRIVIKEELMEERENKSDFSF